MAGTKQSYNVTCVIQVEADTDDDALFCVQDALRLYPATKLYSWIGTQLQEREENK